MTPSEAYFCGFWLGDGSASSKHVRGRRYVSLTINCGEPLNKRIGEETKRFGFDIIWKPGNGSRECHVPARIRDWMTEYGFEFPCSSFTKKIPENFFKEDLVAKAGLTEGLWDTDGWVTKKGDACFASRSKSLRDGVAILLEAFYVDFSTYTRQVKGKPNYEIYVRRPSKLQFKKSFVLVPHKQVRL